MPHITTPVYRNERRTIAWAGQSARPGRVLIDVPDYVLERYGDQLVRIDEDGHIPRYDLEHMRLEDARAIASHAETDEVDVHSGREEIVAALSPDVSDARATLEDQTVDDEAGDEYEEDDTEESWQEREDRTGQTAEDEAAELVADAELRADEVRESESDADEE